MLREFSEIDSFELDLSLKKGKADNDIWYQHKRQWWRFSEDKINVNDDLDNDRIDIDGDNLGWCDSVSGVVTLGGDALDGDALYGDDFDGDDHAGGNLDSDDLDGDNVECWWWWCWMVWQCIRCIGGATCH